MKQLLALAVTRAQIILSSFSDTMSECWDEEETSTPPTAVSYLGEESLSYVAFAAVAESTRQCA